MLRRSLFGLVLAVTTLAGATPAQAASKHRFSVTATESVISQSAGYPNPGSTIIRAGIVTGTFGDGAIVERARPPESGDSHVQINGYRLLCPRHVQERA